MVEVRAWVVRVREVWEVAVVEVMVVVEGLVKVVRVLHRQRQSMQT